jgi:ATP-binding cassette subfamily F protein 3
VCVGCGKSTLISLLMEASTGTTTAGLFAGGGQSVNVTAGEVSRMSGFRVAYYQQNLADKLPYDQSALVYMLALAGPDGSEQLTRAHLGSFGLGGDLVMRPIGTLSGGQKSRIVLAQLTINK